MGHHRSKFSALADALSRPTGVAHRQAQGDMASLTTQETILTPAQIARIVEYRDEYSRQSKMGTHDPAAEARLRNARLQGVTTWGGRPISKWCRYGYWNEDGTELTVTRVDVKRATYATIPWSARWF